MCIQFWEDERDRARAGEGQRERETRNPKQAPGSELSAQSQTRGSNSRTTRSQPEPELDAQSTEPPRCPNVYLFLRQRERESRGGAEREGDRIGSGLQAPSCQHRAPHGARTQEPWDHDLSRCQMLSRLSHPGAPGGVLDGG